MQLTFIQRVWKHRELTVGLAQRDILMRYRGSLVGWGWTLLNPLMMLSIYTFIFSAVFKSRWETSQDLGSAGFALNIFAGMVVFGLFAECANKAPALITSNSNYATKVRFPLEVLGSSVVLSALFHASTSLAILLVFRLIVLHSLPLSTLALPAVWLPYLLFTLAGTWLISALGVFLRDLNQFTTVAVSALTFLSAIFYPISALPKELIPIFKLNPVATWVEQTRSLIVLGRFPNPAVIALEIAVSLLICELSLRLFQKASRGFADVL